MCANSTQRGAVRELRVELLGMNSQSLEEVSLREHYFCSESCALVAGQTLMDEINTGDDPELLPELKHRWRGQIVKVFCLYTSVSPSTGG